MNLSKDPQNIKDTFLQKTTISNLIDLNLVKFLNKKNNLNIHIEKLEKKNEPLIIFSDEIMYGLGNIIQNAIENARNKIYINISLYNEYIFISIADDGKGFTNDVLERIGNPHIFDKKNGNNMGLGIFIAKNLIENIGGNMKFYNKTKDTGSIVEIQLKRNI